MTASDVAKIADRLRNFRRTLTRWTVTNSDDSDLKGALGDAIDALDALRAHLASQEPK